MSDLAVQDTQDPKLPEPTVRVACEGRVAIVTLNRPARMNAIDTTMRKALWETLESLRRDANVGAAVLTGGGDKAFSAGMDLKEFADSTAITPIAEAKRFRWEHADAVAAFDKPIVAAVNGLAIGGGVELALQCDLIFAADSSSFCFAEITRGLIPGNGGTQRLARRIGRARALEMIVSGRTVGADEALRLGLVEHLVPTAELMSRAVALATTFAARPSVAVQAAKAAICRGAEMSLDDGIRLERDLAAFIYTTDDASEGASAFLERRSPQWRGR